MGLAALGRGHHRTCPCAWRLRAILRRAPTSAVLPRHLAVRHADTLIRWRLDRHLYLPPDAGSRPILFANADTAVADPPAVVAGLSAAPAGASDHARPDRCDSALP